MVVLAVVTAHREGTVEGTGHDVATEVRLPRVFVSYSRDSGVHEERVAELVDRLREHAVDPVFDHTVESPPEGWPRWMVRQIEVADFVLMVITETYTRRFTRQDETSDSKGVRWEGLIITQQLYEDASENQRFIPVAFDEADLRHVPLELCGATRYVVSDEEDFQKLISRLTEGRGVPAGHVAPSMPSGAGRQRFPYLASDVSDSTAVLLSGGSYVFRVFSVGERGMEIERPLLREVVEGLASALRSISAPANYLVSIDPGGTSWALLAMNSIPELPRVKMIRNWQSGVRGQLAVPQNEGFYAGRTLWFPTTTPGDRAIVMDDVISSGDTMRLVVRTLRSQAVVPVAIVCIIRKTDRSAALESDLDVPIYSLIDVDG